MFAIFTAFAGLTLGILESGLGTSSRYRGLCDGSLASMAVLVAEIVRLTVALETSKALIGFTEMDTLRRYCLKNERRAIAKRAPMSIDFEDRR